MVCQVTKASALRLDTQKYWNGHQREPKCFSKYTTHQRERKKKKHKIESCEVGGCRVGEGGPITCCLKEYLVE